MVRRILLSLVLVLAGAAVGAQAPAEVRSGSLSLQEPWSRATPGGAKVGAGYLVIENRGSDADRLLAVETDVSEGAEIHETTISGGVARMVPAGALGIPPNGRVELKPGANHLMLTNLKRPLKEGERFGAVLTFEKAGRVPVTFAVRGMGAGASPHHHH